MPRNIIDITDLSVAEIDQLIAALPAGTVRAFERYSADGRAGNLNRYVLLRRTSAKLARSA